MGVNSVIQSLKFKLNSQFSSSSNGNLFPPPGLYHYQRESTGERSRIHLRIDPAQGNEGALGILLVNANRVLHLNPTATLMAYLVLEKYPHKRSIQILQKQYNVSNTQANSDYAQYCADLNELLLPGESSCPVCDLDVEITAPFTSKPAAPYRMDLALTYRCNNDCAHCYNARPRDFPELSTAQWKRIIDKVWETGIPHIVFTGGEPTLREDLPALIHYAEQLGQITGLNTNGRRLSDNHYLMELVDAGLDHVQITIESHDDGLHDSMVHRKGAWRQTINGLTNALDTPLFVMTNTTMLRQNSPSIADTLDFLARKSVPTIGLNALIYSGRGLTVGTGLSEDELTPLLNIARQKTDLHGQRLIWYTPTQYCNFDPMQLELGVKGCTAALYNMCVEPDGGVIPCQSFYHQLGNLLADPWDSIWNHNLSKSLRERQYIPDKCHDCILLQECGGGCPLFLNASNLTTQNQ